MKLTQLRALSLSLIIGIVITSCGGGGSEKASEGAEFDEAKSQIISEIDAVIKDLPPPSEVPYLLMATGSDYNPNLINPLDNSESYASNVTKAALNLGVYTSDIGYLASYEKTQESLDYVSSCQKLAEALGVASAMDLELMSRFERNLNNKDSLRVVVDEILNRTGDRLDALDQMHIAGLVLTGTYIEGLYISTQLIATYPEDLPAEARNLILEPLIKIVIDQKPALDDLLTVMNSLASNAEIADLIGDLNSLKTIYDGELAEVVQQIADNTGDLVLTAEILANLTAEAERIRNSFTNS